VHPEPIIHPDVLPPAVALATLRGTGPGALLAAVLGEPATLHHLWDQGCKVVGEGCTVYDV